MVTAANAIVKCLQEEEIQVVFGYPGAAICPFYDALSSTTIKHILVRHEQNAGHAASGYARMSGKPAVCIATSGPGALNLITSIATAYMDSIPLVVITGQVASDMLGRDVFQEADITGAAEPFVKHSYLVKHATDIPRIFKEAFHIAGTGRQGPVLIDIPVDIQKELIAFEYPKEVDIRSYKPSVQGNVGQIKRVITALKQAKRPLICAGGGVFAAHATTQLHTLSSSLNIPIVTTMMGISSVCPNYEKNLGMIGMHGETAANTAMNLADIILIIGARVGDRAIMSPMGLCKSATIIHIDIDPAEIGKNMEIDIPLVGDAKQILSQICQSSDDILFSDWTSELKSSTIKLKTSFDLVVSPKQVIQTLCEKAPSNTVMVADVGQNQIWSARGYSIEQGRFLTSGGMGTMGYSIPAAVGAKLAQFDRQVVAICGDGSFQMQSMELATIAQNKLPIKIILMNNSCLGMVREVQDNQYNGNQTAVCLDGNPDFIKLATAYSIKSRRISDDHEIASAIEELLNCKEAFLLECIVSSKESTL